MDLTSLPPHLISANEKRAEMETEVMNPILDRSEDGLSKEDLTVLSGLPLGRATLFIQFATHCVDLDEVPARALSPFVLHALNLELSKVIPRSIFHKASLIRDTLAYAVKQNDPITTIMRRIISFEHDELMKIAFVIRNRPELERLWDERQSSPHHLKNDLIDLV